MNDDDEAMRAAPAQRFGEEVAAMPSIPPKNFPQNVYFGESVLS